MVAMARKYAHNSYSTCLLYTSDAADERSSVDLGGRRIIKKKNKADIHEKPTNIAKQNRLMKYITYHIDQNG